MEIGIHNQMLDRWSFQAEQISYSTIDETNEELNQFARGVLDLKAHFVPSFNYRKWSKKM